MMGARLKGAAFAALLVLCSGALAVTPPDSAVTNTAGATYGIGASQYSVTATATVNTAACIDAGLKVELLQYLPPARAALASAGARTEAVQPTAYAPGGAIAGPFLSVGNPVLLGDSAPTALPANLFLAPLSDGSGKPIAWYARNEPIFVRVVSYDANVNPAVADKVSVTVSSANSGESEVLQLTETGASTGVFVGVVPSTIAAAGTVATTNDGKITIAAHNDTVTATFNHVNCSKGGNIASASSGSLDPYGIVFDSRSGAAVNGVTLTLMNTLTNQPSTVHCDDGVTVLPQPVTSGAATVCDAVMAAGAYRFPLVPAGSYRLVAVPPPDHVFASVVALSDLPATIGSTALAPVIFGAPGPTPGGSYGGVFSLTGPAFRMDVPVDRRGISLALQKTTAKTVVGIGEFVPYILTVTNGAAVPVAGALIADHPPPGFRYRKGSARLNGALLADPLIAPDASTLTFTFNIAPSSVATLHYVLEVTTGARTGPAENTAAAVGAFTSNTARASVLVREDLFRDKAILIGRVIDGSCDDKGTGNGDVKGLPDARVVLQDGSYVLTDKEGRWHMDNLRPGTHVVQLDTTSLPEGYEVLGCEANDRFAGRTASQFVNLRGGSLWRANFHVQKRAVGPKSTAIRADAVAGPPAAIAVNTDPIRLVESLPYDEAWLSSAPPGDAWLHPVESFHPNLPVIKFAVKHDPLHKLAWTVNGDAVSPLLFDGTRTSGHVALSIWSGVPVREGDNRVELIVRDAQGMEISRTVRNIHYAATPDRLEFVPQQSRLIADGKTHPMIAVRFLDNAGVPVRRGINGEFQLNEPYRSWVRREGIAETPLAGQIGGKARFEIQADGLAMIELEPTTQSGEAILSFQFNDQRKQEVRAWLDAGQRDWILVGFAQGTAGHATLSGNLQALQAADAERQLFDGNALAFYAKGSIRGDYLLTMAYDTSKQTGANLLKQAVDPTQYYTLYADGSQARFDAASASRLYVKLERKQFYAMFGDYDTGLTVTELSRYSRTLNGVKSEFKGETIGYSAFATRTAQAYVKDEIPGNGTSGVYKLSRGNLVINSDKIRIEVRDRFQSQIIVSTQSLTPYLDYNIDYALGTLTFRSPVAIRDSDFNPTVIVAEYESADPNDQAFTFGGRGSVKPTKDTELGATLIHEGTVGATGNLRGVDASYQWDDNTRLRAEAAASTRNLAGVASRGGAWLAEVQHHEEQWDAKAYIREQGVGFGLGQQASSEVGMRKMGADGRLSLSETLRVQVQAYQQENLATSASNSLVEARMDKKFGDDLNAYYGARAVDDKNATGTAQSRQFIGGAAYTTPDKKLVLHSAIEIGSGIAASVNAPDRVVLGADYKLTEETRAFAAQEFARGASSAVNTTSFGLRTRPWSGGEVSTSVGNSTQNDANRLFANLGLVQRWQINKQWQTDFSIDRSQSLRGAAVSLNSATAPTFGSIAGGYTVAAVGAAYRDGLWSGNARLEIRNATADQQKNVLIGLQRNIDDGTSLAASVILRDVNGTSGSTRNTDLRVSYAHRPNEADWIWFNRTDYIAQSSRTSDSVLDGAKLVNNLSANSMLTRRTQLSLLLGVKYVQDVIDATDYRGFTYLVGAEIRHDLTPDWDIGAFGSTSRLVKSGVSDFGVGVSIGYKLMENTWLSVGYNVRGLNDRDLGAAGYRARGPFISLRAKFDQDTLGLNDHRALKRPANLEP